MLIWAHTSMSGKIPSPLLSPQSPKANPTKTLTLTLKYSASGERVISGLKRISKPGLRVYKEADALPKVLNGLGIAIVSTPKGLLTDYQARKAHVGGEVLCYVW
jgi:small subunit ribosomal protein S8